LGFEAERLSDIRKEGDIMQKRLWIAIISGLVILLNIGVFIGFSASANDDLLYFPLNKTGSQWVYKVTFPDNKILRQDLAVLAPNDQIYQLGITINDSPEAAIQFSRNEQGLFKLKEVSADAVVKYEPAQLVLSSKLTVGTTWKWESAANKATIKVKVLNGGKISVSAGNFDTILVRTEGTDEEGNGYVDQTWYAKGIGYVKSIVTANDKTRTEELMSYQLGK
jgi:hypothetical protein